MKGRKNEKYKFKENTCTFDYVFFINVNIANLRIIENKDNEQEVPSGELQTPEPVNEELNS